jgi:hypothetical protein
MPLLRAAEPVIGIRAKVLKSRVTSRSEAMLKPE